MTLRIIALLLVPPILLARLVTHIKKARGPYWMAYSCDPEYAYLFGSFRFAEARRSFRIDHPGVPLYQFEAAMMRLLYPKSDRRATQAAVLCDPEKFLKACNRILATSYILANTLLGFFAYKITGRPIAGLLVQSSPFLSEKNLQALARLTPETMLLLVDVCYSAVLLGQSRGISAVAGLGLATKITFAPLTMIPIFTISSWKMKAVHLVKTTLFFVAFTRRAWAQYPQMFRWFAGLMRHQESYATGKVGLPDPRKLLTNIKSLVSEEPSFFAIAVIAATAAMRTGSKLLQGISLSNALTMAMVAKHPGPAYLVPSMGLSGTTLWLAYDSLPQKKQLFGLFFAGALATTAYKVRKENRVMAEWRKDAIDIEKRIERDYENFTIVHHYSGSSLTYALFFADYIAGKNCGNVLAELRPPAYFYNVWTQKYCDWTTEATLEEILSKHAQVLFRGCRFRESHKKFKPKVPLKEVFAGRHESLYLVE